MQFARPPVAYALTALGIASLDLGDGVVLLLTNGRDEGVQATIAMIPSKRVAVICLTNVTGNATDEIAFNILDVLVPGFMGRFSKRGAEYEAWASRPYQPTPDVTGEWAGVVRVQRRRSD